MICIDFSAWDWDVITNISSLVGATASVMSIILVICIFRKWKSQKQKEVVALEASNTVEKIRALKEDVMAARTGSGINLDFIEDVRQQYESIEYSLELINIIEKELEYETYINSITKLIEKWQWNKEEQDEYLDFCTKTDNLCKSLNPLKLFMNINQPVENRTIKYRRIF